MEGLNMASSNQRSNQNSANAKATSYSKQTKEELQKHAKKCDIKGYESMNKEQLVDALQHQK